MSKGSKFLASVVRGKGSRMGIPSLCSSNPYVIEAALEYAKRNETFILIEATANQVNQYGGYTNMTPKDFREFVFDKAKALGCPTEYIILGGDHLGPVVFKDQPAVKAMQQAEEMIRAFVSAGFDKIHIDTSMRLGDDDAELPLTDEVIARRGARLCAAAEDAYERTFSKPADIVYIIGSEVPVPGGTVANETALNVTSAEDFESTYAEFEKAFAAQKLEDAFKRVIAVVVQPGVEFGDASTHEYSRESAKHLIQKLKTYSRIAFEGHSTDYQTPQSLNEMVEDGIAILKVGPELTFALREGLFALQFILNESGENSNFIEALNKTMSMEPHHWEKYYKGTEQEILIKRKYSYSDRWRYYASQPEIIEAINKLFLVFNNSKVPLPLISQFMPEQYKRIKDGAIKLDAEAIVKDKIREIIEKYYLASK